MNERQYEIHTDLALEARERFEGDAGEIPGVSLEEWYEEQARMKVTRVDVLDEQGASLMRKEIGTYITLEADFRDYEEACQKILAHWIRSLLPEGSRKILAVGLGNKELTADSFGPIAVSHLWITGHLAEEGMSVSGISPGVMAQTGMETARIVEGIVRQMRPDALLVMDSLAARSTERLGRTIQLTDTGICPGSGVGNHRRGLNRRTLGIPVIAIGVPTVVGGATIARDTLEGVLSLLCKQCEEDSVLKKMNSTEREMLVRQIAEPRFGALYVTPKDIDETVLHLGAFVADGINTAIYGYLL